MISIFVHFILTCRWWDLLFFYVLYNEIVLFNDCIKEHEVVEKTVTVI